MAFEWDEDKRSSNLEKHGVDFVRVAKIFRSLVFENLDEREDYGEERIIALGHTEGSFYVVIYTLRDKNRRIISAWKASKNDKEKYYSHFRRRT